MGGFHLIVSHRKFQGQLPIGDLWHFCYLFRFSMEAETFTKLNNPILLSCNPAAKLRCFCSGYIVVSNSFSASTVRWFLDKHPPPGFLNKHLTIKIQASIEILGEHEHFLTINQTEQKVFVFIW